MIVAEPEPHMAHLLPVLLSIVRQHVGNQEPPPRLQHPRGFGERAGRVGHMMEHEQQRGGIELLRPRSAGPRALRASPRHSACPRSRRLAAWSISPDRSTAMTRATKRASAEATCPVPQPRSPTTQRSSRSAGSACRCEAAPNRSSRSLSHWPAADSKNSSDFDRRPRQDALEPPRVLIRPGRRADLVPQQGPQPPRRRVALVERQGVVPARALAARHDPVRISQRLQMPAHRGLRQLKDRAELRHRQLMPIQQEQHPAPRGVREDRQVVEDRRVHRATSIRKSGLMVTYNARRVKPRIPSGVSSRTCLSSVTVTSRFSARVAASHCFPLGYLPADMVLRRIAPQRGKRGKFR